MFRFSLLIVAGLVFSVLGAARAHEGEKHQTDDTRNAVEAVVGKPAAGTDEKAHRYFTDRRVVTQDGEELRFYSDVLKDRVVVVTLFYTDCQTMCPLTNQKLAQLQDLLGDDMGREYFFVSVSLDPETDTPEILKEYAANFDAGEGWYFLTGDKEDLREITRRLGQLDDNIATHSPFFMLGNVPGAHWSRVPPNHPVTAIAQRLRLMNPVSAAQ
jgi:cytochrome oxidase Cu insertion factor (SCO1/SenC/PrrC family)